MTDASPIRCAWCVGDPLMEAYHDAEWGVPVRDPRMLWEMLMLEGFQAGLAWITVLRKREGFRKAFAGFDPEKVARFGARDVSRLLADDGIIRSRAKIDATIRGAQPFGDKAIERRQCRDRHAADQEYDRSLRHAMDQSAEFFQVAGAGRIEDRARTEKQQALEQRMIENVKQPSGESQRGGPREPFRLEGQRKSERGKYDQFIHSKISANLRTLRNFFGQILGCCSRQAANTNSKLEIRNKLE